MANPRTRCFLGTAGAEQCSACAGLPLVVLAIPDLMFETDVRKTGAPLTGVVAPAMLGSRQLGLAVDPFCGVGLLKSPLLTSEPSSVNVSWLYAPWVARDWKPSESNFPPSAVFFSFSELAAYPSSPSVCVSSQTGRHCPTE